MAGSLALWLSGFVFLFCCGTMPFKAKTESCPLAKTSGHCNKGNQAKDTPTFSGESTAMFNCCEFIPKVYDKFRYFEKAKKDVQPAGGKPEIERTQFIAVENRFETARTFHQTALAQPKIFIRNCVFRI